MSRRLVPSSPSGAGKVGCCGVGKRQGRLPPLRAAYFVSEDEQRARTLVSTTWLQERLVAHDKSMIILDVRGQVRFDILMALV